MKGRPSLGRGMVAGLCVLVLVFGSTAPALGAPGGLDFSFSGDGRLTADFTSSFDLAFDVAIQDDGKIVVAGRAGGKGGRVVVARYTTAGALDPTFSGDGRTFTDFTSGDDVAYGVAIQPDGKIVIAGAANRFSSSTRVALARYRPNGTLDPTFSGDGKAAPQLPPRWEYGLALALLDNGRIVVSGTARPVSGGVVTSVFRFTASGAIDQSFSGDGWASVNLGSGDEAAEAIALRPDGSPVVSGWVAAGRRTGGYRTSVVRFTPSGAKDPTWNGTGRVVMNVVNGYEDAISMAIQGDGAVVVGGEAEGKLALHRFLDTGALDPAFSGDGREITDLPGAYEWISGLALQPDGTIVVGGQIGGSGGRMFAARYQTGGGLDTTFGTGGFTAIDFTPKIDLAYDVALQQDGAIVLAGSAGEDSRIALARLLGS